MLEKNLDLSNEGLQAILDEVSRVAPKIKAEELVHRRFLNEMKTCRITLLNDRTAGNVQTVISSSARNLSRIRHIRSK